MRRICTGLGTAVVLVAIAALAGVPGTMAYTTWCWDDPIVSINGTIVAIDIGVGMATADSITAATSVNKLVQKAETVIYVPAGAEVKRVGTTRVHFPESVRFVTVPDAQIVRIEVTFKAKADLPAAMKIDGVLAAQGSTFGTLTATIPVP